MKSHIPLIIVESPNKAKKINEMFAGRFHAKATFGHVCDLPSNPTEGIGIDRPNMKGLYELTEDKKRTVDGKRVIDGLKKYIDDHPGVEVYLGTDEDREGESIAAFVMKYLRLQSPKRMRFNAILPEKIEQAFANADEIDWAAVSSREARRLIDRIIGYVASPVLRNIVKEKGVAAGRVQTAVEALVIEREFKIRAFKPQTFYSVHMDFGGWEAVWQIPATPRANTGPMTNSEYDIDDTTARCFDEALAKQMANQRALVVASCSETFELKLPPSPLYTISMLQVANRVLGWDADKTMQIAQKLFEGDGAGHGHITYHRTDSPNMDEAPAEEIRVWLKKQGLPVAAERNMWKCKNKQAQEGHEAIRPSYFEEEEAGVTEEQKALYRLIRERAIYSQLAPARYAVKKIVLVDAVNGKHKFTATARVLVDPGWLETGAAQSSSMSDEEDDKSKVVPTVTLPDLKSGALINVVKSEVKSHTTKRPPRYTINTLTSKLETLSIGRPATMATLLKNVQIKGTVVLNSKKQLEPTPVGERCYNIVYPRLSFAHIGYTAELEQALDQIAGGRIDGQNLVRSVWDRLDTDCAALITIPGASV